MAEFINLVCPSCGGKLKIFPNTTVLTCQHCGNEHMIKHDAGGAILLEAFARCPVCGRNDKVEKVTAVLAHQSQEITGTEQKTEVKTDSQGKQHVEVKEVPFSRMQVSVLGQRLAEPTPPDPSHFPPFPQPPKSISQSGGIAAIVFGALGLVSSAVCCLSSFLTYIAINDPGYHSSTDPAMELLIYIVLGVIFVLGGAGLLALGIYRVVRYKKTAPTAAVEYQQQVEAVQREHERIRSEYEQSVARWKQLYYCSRDDCIFIPGKNTSAPVTAMSEYLLSFPPDPPPA